jgi:putative ABC transport system substrate-binding protein
MIRRREVLTLLGGATAWPVVARAQQGPMPVISFLGLAPAPKSTSFHFRQGLAEVGCVPGLNVVIESHSANFQHSILPQLAADLVNRKVAAIVTTDSPYVALAAKAATSTIPIVFIINEDPVDYGLVASLNRPGGNVTGVTFLTTELAGKRLSLLLELVPGANIVGYLSGPSESPTFEDRRSEMLAAGRALGREIIVGEVRRLVPDHGAHPAREEGRPGGRRFEEPRPRPVHPGRGGRADGHLDFEAAFATFVERRARALIVGNFSLFNNPRDRNKICELAARHELPAMYPGREYGISGGLMSYGATFEQLRKAGIYTGRIIKGEDPANLPVLQPTKFEFVLNLKAAKTIGLNNVPDKLLALADEVIE